MKKLFFFCSALFLGSPVFADPPALTIYNQDFAVVRDTVHLDLKAGLNTVNYNEATRSLEPDSVVLRDPTGRRALQILEQNYRADPVSQGLLLDYYVGRTIDFETQPEGVAGRKELVRGKIIRSGYVPQQPGRFGPSPIPAENEPIIEVKGKLIFQLPGVPLFPGLPDDGILRPTLTWELNSSDAGRVDAELGYVTGGMSWEAAYNLIAPEKGDTLDLVGWVTIVNHTGKMFTDAKIKLMAGDVNKLQAASGGSATGGGRRLMYNSASLGAPPPVTEKSFDDYHLYSLARATTLRSEETKQVEFVRASGIPAKPVYIYDGALLAGPLYGWSPEMIRDRLEYGTEFSPKVMVMREFLNAESNHLGMPLPKGRMRFYRRDTDAQLEFTGENSIDHTPRNEKIRVIIGDAFDLVGERKRTNHKLDTDGRELDESFEIKVRNHKKESAKIRVVEHLYRWPTWEITAKSADYEKKDAQTIEFQLNIKPDGEQTVTYTVHYSW
jgi:hypothetical protein